jgi:hypothetical protein
MNVTANELRSRLALIEARWHYFKQKSDGNGGMLPRHEIWRHAYVSDPYLIGAPAERLGQRFQAVFANVTELGKNGIGMLPADINDIFMEKFTHLLEEYGSRGGQPPNDVLAAARAPILRYFEKGDPIAVRIFKDYKPPTTAFTVKYGRREFLEPMLRKGRLRICPATYYNDSSHNAAVRDDEIHRTFFIPTYLERLRGEHHLDFQGHRIAFGDDDIVLPVVAPDYFLLSLCDSVYYRMPTDFDADAALIIKDPNRFAQRVISSFLARFADWKPLYGPVTYYDPYRDYTKIRVHEMSKPFGYAYQREVRIVMQAKRRPRETLQPEFLDVGPMDDYAELTAGTT